MARVKTAKQTAVALKSKATKTDSKGKKSAPSKGAPQKEDGKPSSKHTSSNDLLDGLKAEILALGGDEEDYELLKDIDSDEEPQAGPSSSKADKSLSKDISKLLKDLKLPEMSLEAFGTAEEEEDDEDEDEEEDEGDDAEMSEEDEESNGTESETGVKGLLKKAEDEKVESTQTTAHKTDSKSGLLFEPTPQWYDVLPPLPPQKSTSPPNASSLNSIQERAKTLHTDELAQYEKSNSANKLTASSSDAAFLQRVLSSGTLSDRLSALTLLAQSSPVHNLRALETLKQMGSKKGREESLKALRAIVDWWTGGGAPSRKLKYFIDQPLTHPNVTDKHLVAWYFEDWLKKYFYSILQLLETLSLDPLSYVRLQTMGLILNLLKEKPEQEQNLLRLLVNKLGDSDKPVASRASYHLLQLLQAHPSMKGVVVREMTSLVLRPSRANVPSTSKNTKGKPEEKRDLQQDHSRYYAAITCNQIMLSPSQSDQGVAVQLINVYFEIFKEILGQEKSEKDVIDADVVVNEDKEAHRKGKSKGTDKGKGRDKGKAKEEGFTEVEDASSRLISAILTGVNRALPFAKLGLENVEFTKHVDTLFLITHTSTFNISLQALRLILQICESFITSPTESASGSSISTTIIDRFYRTLYGSLQDPRLATSSKQAMYLNLLLKSMKLDHNFERVKAFVRRFVQLLVSGGNGGVEFVAGGLFLLGEVFKLTPDIKDMLENTSPVKGRKKDIGETGAGGDYDPRKREPQFANASATPLWELMPLLSHYHPTVQLHASQLLSGKELNADADLSLNTLSHFLDRFVYKNPKKLKPKGTSAMQPSAAPSDGTSVRVVKGAHEDAAAVNDEAFWSKNIQNVPVDQVFFHKYFSQKNKKETDKADKVAKRKGAAETVTAENVSEDEGKPRENRDEDEDEDEDDAEEAEIWKAIKATNPDLQGSDDESALDSDQSDVSSEEDEASDANEEDGGDPDRAIEDGDGDGDGMSLVEDSDAEDLIGLDDEMPAGFMEYPASDSDDGDEWGGLEDGSKKKRKGRHEDDQRKKKKLRSLPTFASYDDYAKLIEDGPEDDI